MARVGALLLVASVMSLIVSCGHPKDDAVPRRPGYYRLEQYPAQYQWHNETPRMLYANACAKFSSEKKEDGSYWATVAYPRYKAYIYYTFTPLAERDATALVENRLERMRLDLGNATDLSTEEYLNPNGINVWTIFAPQALNTPVKFLAMDKDWMISGTAFLDNATDADSVAPVIEILTRDVRYSMLTLGDGEH